jgi:16S rRNA (uracil1498-N3)-methyltransferase
MVRKRYFTSDHISQNRKRIALTGDEYHHLVRVSRAREGEEVTVLDGVGGIYEATVARLGRNEAVLRVRSYRRAAGPPRIDMALALTRAHRLDFAVEKCTEIGTRQFIPFTAERSVWRGGEREAAHKRERLERKVMAACKQSENPYFPAVEEVSDFDRLISMSGEYAAVCFGDREGAFPLTGVEICAGGQVLGIVGPEGGFTDRERERLIECGAHGISLGPHALRSETAAICLLFHLHELFSSVEA